MRNYRGAFCAFVAVAILIGLLAFASPGGAQEIFGSVVGTVSDPGGAVLPGTTIKVTNLGTGEARSAVTDGQGNYQLLSLPVGEYKLEVDAHGFKHYSRSPIDVRVNSVARANVAMEVGAQSENVVVTTAAPIMQTESASLGQVVEGNAVATLPLNGRNVLALVALVPGVVPQGAASTNLSGQNVFAAGNYQIDGGNANQSSILVDGSSVNTSYGNAAELVMDQDVVQEFNVQTHNNTAEFGAYTGGVINMTTKSGTNAFHGLAFEYLRNTVLDANSFFSNRTGAGRQAWHQNQFGANGGGPIKKDKVFFFADYQGYRETNGQPILNTVPTAQELQGDFSAITATIYDPLTTCGYNGNPACTAAQQAGTAPQRQQFSYNGVANVIPPNRFSTVAQNLIKFPIYAKPNVQGSATATEGAANNFSILGTAGGTNDQYTLRGDQTLSAKQTMFERYTHWHSANIDPTPFGNNLYYTSLAPEVFTTQQMVVGDTLVFSPTSIADVHLSYLRWNYNRIPTNFGLDESAKFGWPSYMNFGSLNNLPKSTAVPMMSISGPISYYEGGAGYIFSINNNYAIASTYQKVLGRHTLKAGVDLRRLEMNYFQNNNPGGIFTFDNAFTNSSPSSAAANGNGLASLELGYVSNSASQTVQTAPPTYETQYYQGYFVMDTWQATNKITATLGIRYEVPGVFVARQGWADTFNPTEMNPIVNVPGAFDLVSSQQHPAAGVRNENWTDWAPRLGVAYRLDSLTVIRGAWGRFFVPADLQFPEAPLQAGINFLNNLMVSTTNGQETPNNFIGGVYTTQNTLDNPYPNGLVAPPHRNPNYQQVLLGGNPQALYANEPNGETFQWNFAIERQLPLGIALEVAYSGLKGQNLPVSLPINPLPDSVIAKAAADPVCSVNYTSCYLNQQVTNPYFGLISQGVLKQATVTQAQLLRPFPQYGSISNSGHYIGVSHYNAMELKLQKRMPNGGMILGSYTFSKLMTDSEYLTSWLDSTGSAGYQDYNNPMSNYSLSSFDARQRLIVSYIYPLPIGKGRMLLPHLNAIAEAVIGGWGINGITTFQEGFPLGFSSTPNNLSSFAFQGTERPNVVAGCGKKTSGPMFKRLGGAGSTSTYFNTACFTIPANFAFGNESRTDNQLRQPGQANWDMSLYKDIPITERSQFEFRAEAFNVFNRVQFGPPSTTVGSSTEGFITSQYNNPRLFQVSGRISF
jgi:hypothetical protein